MLFWPGCGPNPKNDSVDSATTAPITDSVSATRIGPIEFGSRCDVTIRKLDAPTARDASMNSRSFSASTWPRTRRATYIQPNTANSTMMNRIEDLSPMIGVRNCETAEELADQDDEDQEREGQEQVGDTHHEVVELAAPQAGKGTDRGADQHRQDRRGDADEHRRADAVQQPGVHVAPDVVGAEPGDVLTAGGTRCCPRRS